MDAKEADLVNTWVSDIPTSWGLRKLIPNFERNHITEEIFFEFNGPTIGKLIPRIGLNILPKEKLDKLMKCLDINGKSDKDKTAHPQDNGSSNDRLGTHDSTENHNPTDNSRLGSSSNIQTGVTGTNANSTTSRFLSHITKYSANDHVNSPNIDEPEEISEYTHVHGVSDRSRRIGRVFGKCLMMIIMSLHQ
ncbi:hypothetical protein QAD02_003875 [Eretmocerus hayati]|uniref:Uncharacterized protein n=1 Tax=Eretmocerus hayati TaxID=131215 RepID=A0ACC2NNY0_9HYME|nr:hypothetical protein QAD02_003875 [Eretmocerus hayati]